MKEVIIQGKAYSLTPSGGLTKDTAIEMWDSLAPQTLKPTPIMYKHSGSTIDEDGVRITGSPEFIAAVMERLKDLMQYEAGKTRLGIAFGQLNDKQGNEIKGRFRCSIQVHQRGSQSIHRILNK